MKRELEEYLQLLEAEKMNYDFSGMEYPEELQEEFERWGIAKEEMELIEPEDIEKIPF